MYILGKREKEKKIDPRKTVHHFPYYFPRSSGSIWGRENCIFFPHMSSFYNENGRREALYAPHQEVTILLPPAQATSVGCWGQGGGLGYTLKLELQDPNSLAKSTEGCKILKIRQAMKAIPLRL